MNDKARIAELEEEIRFCASFFKSAGLTYHEQSMLKVLSNTSTKVYEAREAVIEAVKGPEIEGGGVYMPRLMKALTNLEQAEKGEIVCPECGGDTFLDFATPCGDHPELTTQWRECNLCDWHGEELPVQQMADEVERLKADAARYRHLRASGHFGGAHHDLIWFLPRRFDGKDLGTQLDEAIDSQIDV